MNKTKEEILREHIGLLPYVNSYEKSNSIFAAMSEYAKQEAIEFGKWCGQNCNDDLDRYNITSLYYIYLKSKTK